MAKKKDDAAHYTAILAEGLRSDFKLVIEKVESLDDKVVGLEKKMDERFTQQDDRFDRIEVTLQSHSRKFQEIEGKLDHHSRKFQEIEGKLDHVIEKVEKHDQEIQHLKTA